MLAGDLRYAARMLAEAQVSTAAALSIALGIGANRSFEVNPMIFRISQYSKIALCA